MGRREERARGMVRGWGRDSEVQSTEGIVRGKPLWCMFSDCGRLTLGAVLTYSLACRIRLLGSSRPISAPLNVHIQP